MLAILGLAWTLVPSASASRAEVPAADAFVESVGRHLDALTQHPSRMPGTPGYEAALQYLREAAERVALEVPGAQVRQHDYPLMVPVTTTATLELDGTTIDVFPFTPAASRLSATGEQGVTGRLVYCGTARPDELLPLTLRGSIAVVEASAGERWMQPFYFGAKGVVVLGHDGLGWPNLQSHDVRVPANLPRVFLPDGELAEVLRQSGDAATDAAGDVTLTIVADWKPVTASNLYLLLPADAGGPADGATRRLLGLTAAFDTAGLVSDLSPGASSAYDVATVLATAEQWSGVPRPRPVLISFVGGDGMALQGSRQLHMALSEPPSVWRDRHVQETRLLEADIALAGRLGEIGSDPLQLDRRRDRSLLERLSQLAESETADLQTRLFRLRIRDAATLTDEEAAERDRLLARSVELGMVRASLRRDVQELADDPDRMESARQFIAQLNGRLSGTREQAGTIEQRQDYLTRLQARVDLYEWIADAAGVTRNPRGRSSDERPIDVIVGLNLSDGGTVLGPVNWGQFFNADSNALLGPLRAWFDENRNKPWVRELRGAVDLADMANSRLRLAAPMGSGVEVAAAWGVPGLSFATLNDARLRLDTPADTVDALDLDRLAVHARSALQVLNQALGDPTFRVAGGFPRRNAHADGQVLDLSPGRPVADLPKPGFIAMLYHGRAAKPRPMLAGEARWTLGVRRLELVDTDAEGRYRFEGLDLLGVQNLRHRVVQVYRVQPGSGRIEATTDTGQIGDAMQGGFELTQGALRPLKSLAFDCEEFALVGLYDPRFLQTLGTVMIMDARRNADPQKYNLVLHEGILAGFVEPFTRNYLLFRYGQVGNRLVLLNVDADGAEDVDGGRGARARRIARGFEAAELNATGPLSLVTARDFWRLDNQRLRSSREAGVSSALLDELHEETRQYLAEADTALEADQGRQFIRAANGAWATEALVYAAAQDMAADVVRAAVFLLILCVPFAFCMERLVVGTPDIYKQIAGTLGIFAIMAFALWMFHPAFRISNSALVIILAFAILFMSGLVIWVVYSRFDSELKKVRLGKTGVSGSGGVSQSFARASVVGQAVMLGIANMRRRRFRTLLTSVTVVLITFAVLCFTSASTYTSVASLPTGQTSEYNGIMLRQRGFRPIPAELLDQMKAVFPERQAVSQWWNLGAQDTFRLYVENPVADAGRQRVQTVRGAVGVSPGEERLTPVVQVFGEPAAARLLAARDDVVCLPRPVAEVLGVGVGSTVVMAGLPLEVVSVFDPDTFDTRMVGLSGEPVAPLDLSANMLDAAGQALTGTGAQQLQLDAAGAGAEAEAVYDHLSGNDLVVVPAHVSARLPEYTLRTVTIRLPDNRAVDEAAQAVTRRFALATYAAYDDGVRLVAATQPTSVAGAAVAVPLAIGGLIIFNTMMGSIAERRREIHVYTSLGLAPTHVGALFVAEAMTYGLIGAVFGYVIGQLVATGLQTAGWLGGVTLNYSGTSAMLTLGLILLVVLLSALVPARIASKIAAPSIDRSWRVPQPVDGRIEARLPFTINKTAAAGALAYLAEYFDAHREGTIGRFSTDDIEAFMEERPDGLVVNGLRSSVWLTPFDLGVRQTVEVRIQPGDIEDVYEVDVALMRVSGDDHSWYRMNRSFLTQLRQQFLQWRSLTPQRMLEYIEESKQMFGGRVVASAAASPVAPADSPST